MMETSRRAFVMGGCAALISLRARAQGAAFADIEKTVGGRVGVAALDTSSSARLSYRGDERFAMCSSFKWILAVSVLARVDRGEITLEQEISYSASDLLDYSPVTSVRVTQGRLPVETLCQAIVEVSDNAAANLLLTRIGGPAGFTQFVRGLGDGVTRLDRNEPGLNSNLPGDARDTTSPNAMIGTMQKILLGDVLSPASRQLLTGWLKNSQTGFARLRAGLPANWIAGDKTGSGSNGAAIDNAIVWPPGRAPILIASYLSESTRDGASLNAAHAQIARSIVAAL